MTADEMRNRLLQTLWSMGELEPLIRSGSEFDPARRAILKLQWRAQQLEFKLMNLCPQGAAVLEAAE